MAGIKKGAELRQKIIDTAWEPYVATVTVQVAASVVVSCILAPIITSWWAKKHGCPKMPLEGQEL